MGDDTDVAEPPAPGDSERDRAEPSGGGYPLSADALVGSRHPDGRVRTSSGHWAEI